jgi:hypothetical protein
MDGDFRREQKPSTRRTAVGRRPSGKDLLAFELAKL